MMKTLCTIIVLTALVVPVALLSRKATVNAAAPALIAQGPAVSVDFELVKKPDGQHVVVKITNRRQKEVTVEHPGNRSALAFLVMNEHGNVIAPTGYAKVNMVEHEDIVLKPGETFEHTVPAGASDKYLFQFVSDTALFGYELEPGKKYRVVAVYRPDGKDGEGVCSKEKVIDLAPRVLELRS